MKNTRFFPLGAGLLLIFFGSSILVNLFVNVNIPTGRIFWGILLCFFGYHIIVNHRYRYRSYKDCWDTYESYCNSTTMSSATIEVDEESFNNSEPFEYRTTMGNSIIDMTRIYPTDEQPKKKHIILIDTHMGKTILKINKKCTFCIHARGTMSNVTLPDGSVMTPGSQIFCSQQGNTTPDLDIYALTVLGSLDIIVV